MALLIDFLPIVLFFAAYFISGEFYTALLVIMVAAPIALRSTPSIWMPRSNAGRRFQVPRRVMLKADAPLR